jgi:hypothetical protein
VDDEFTWKLTDKGEKKFVLELADESGKGAACSFTWISKDEFTVERLGSASFGSSVKGFHCHRKKDAPAVAFPPRSTVVADETLANKWIVGSWQWVIRLDPEKYKAELAKAEDLEKLEFTKRFFLFSQKLVGSYDFREDGSFTTQITWYFKPTKGDKEEGTWKLMDKGGKGLVLELGKVAHSLIWISKDEFIAAIPKDSDFPYLKGFHCQRKKDAPKP